MLIRGIGRIESIEELKQSVITAHQGTPVLLSDVADVKIGAALKRGDASLDGKKAVVVMVNKQPMADTSTVTKAVEAAMEEIKPSLPPDVKVTVTFRQSDFIDASIHNVRDSLRDGIIIVSIILFLFLMNWRTAAITLSAIPLSLLICLMLMNLFGQGINTMTLGGLAVAIGSVVDDSIVDMENCYRGLRKNQLAGNPKPPFQVVYDTSVEVRVSVLFSTVIIAVVFAPIFSLTGVEGRIFAPMGVAYLVSIFASTFVALTLSPALCAILLANQQLPEEETWKAIADFESFQEKLMHLIVVSDDLQVFLHLHPDYKGNGRFEVEANLPKAGAYTIFSDYKPMEQPERVYLVKTTVTGAKLVATAEDTNLTKMFGNTQVNLTFDQPTIKAGEEVIVGFNLQDTVNNQPVTDLQPYLGERGHLVILKQSSNLTAADYIHAHALKDYAAGEVKFVTHFPEPGTYKLWGQFDRNGEIVTADFWVNVQ
nr:MULTISPECIES: efflux RND transporter permease subunit [unclassified Coleofasciculus]